MNIIRSINDPALPMTGTAIALGVFDGLHMGHRSVLDAVLADARESGRTPCVMAFALSKPPPRYKQGAVQLVAPGILKKQLCHMGFETVFAPNFDEIRQQTPEQFVGGVLAQRMGARFVSCGYNFSFGRGGVGRAADLERLCAAQGIACTVVPAVDLDGGPVSSTRIRQCLSAGEIPQANALLGWPFTIDFEVVCGNRIGRTLGFPTINQVFPPYFIIPRHGVYATMVRLDDKAYSGVTNVGVKPTVGDYKPLAETYIHGFSGDLYGRRVEVAFLEFIRTERKFGSLEELRANILRDARRAGKIVDAYMQSHGNQKNKEKENRS